VPWSLCICTTQLPLVQQVGSTASQNQDTHLYLPHNNSSVHLTTTEVWHSGQITDGMWCSWRTLQDSLLSSLIPTSTFLEWPCKEQCGSSLTASAPVSDISALITQMGCGPSMACSVAQWNRLFTIMSFMVQSIDLLMEGMS